MSILPKTSTAAATVSEWDALPERGMPHGFQTRSSWTIWFGDTDQFDGISDEMKQVPIVKLPDGVDPRKILGRCGQVLMQRFGSNGSKAVQICRMVSAENDAIALLVESHYKRDRLWCVIEVRLLNATDAVGCVIPALPKTWKLGDYLGLNLFRDHSYDVVDETNDRRSRYKTAPMKFMTAGAIVIGLLTLLFAASYASGDTIVVFSAIGVAVGGAFGLLVGAMYGFTGMILLPHVPRGGQRQALLSMKKVVEDTFHRVLARATP